MKIIFLIVAFSHFLVNFDLSLAAGRSAITANDSAQIHDAELINELDFFQNMELIEDEEAYEIGHDLSE